MSVLKDCHYSRQRNSANGIPFLVLSVRKDADIKKIWLGGMTPFVFDLNQHLKHSKCRVALYDQFAWMLFPPNDERNLTLVAPEGNPTLAVHNRFSVLCEAGAVGMREEATEPRVGTSAHAPATVAATVARKDTGKFKAGCLNVRGLKIASQSDKVSDIGAVLRDKGVNICAVQETWLDPSIDEIMLPGYHFVGSAGYPTSTRLGGGTGFLIGDDMVSDVDTLVWRGKRHAQATWVRVKGTNRRNHLIIASVYVPPVSDTRSSADVTADFENLAIDIEYWSKKSKVLVCGDLNARIGNSSGETAEVYPRVPRFGEDAINAEGKALIQLLAQCDLFSLANRFGPETQYTCLRTQGNSVVDYLLGPRALLKCARSVTHHPLDDDTDHVLMCVDIPSKLEKRPAKPKTNVRWRLNKFEDQAVAKAYRDLMSEEVVAATDSLGELSEESSQSEIDLIATQVTDIIVRVASSTIGKKLSKGRRTAPWWTAEYNEIRVKSQQSYELAMRTKDPQDWDAFVSLRKDKNRLKRKLKAQQSVADQMATVQLWDKSYGSKRAWQSAKQLRNSRAGFARKASTACQGIHDSQGNFVNNPQQIASVFKTHYAKLASPSEDPDFLEDHRIHIETDFRKWQEEGKDVFQPELDGEFTEEEINSAIDHLPLHKSADSDDITGELIRNGGGDLKALLMSLLNRVWRNESVPTNWGTGIIVSLYKAGDSTDPGNYRGITLISIIRKLFSTMVRLRLEKTVGLHESQCAFREGRSCIDHIFTMAQMVNESGATKQPLYAFFLDIKKAYDVVWREGLFYKLKAKGVKGKMWRVLLDLFSKSQSSVRIAGEMSESFPLMVGVGQGDPLSTLLFDIYIDDLLESMHADGGPKGICVAQGVEVRALTYADDLNGLTLDPQDLQVSINHVAEWLKRWRMQANKVKSVVMVFHPKEGESASVPAEQRLNTWTLDGHALSQVQSYKYLGVWFTESGSWDLHASKALGKMRAALGYWRPLLACHRIPIKTRAMMIQTFIYSSVLFGSEVWSTSQVNRRCFDVVAKEAMRAVMGLQCAEVASEVLFTDLGLLPPSLLMDASKQCYDKHLSTLQGTRWCKLAKASRFPGHRAVGRPRAGANWQGEVQKFSADICHDLNISDIFKAPTKQQVARRISSRSQGGVHTVNMPVLGAEALPTEEVDRQHLLDNIWSWYLIRGKARYVASPHSAVPWKWTCIGEQPRSLASYLSSLPSVRARTIMSARSGKLFALRSRLQNQTYEFVNPLQYHCNDCDEHLGDAHTGCVHCTVDCPILWPKIDQFLETVGGLGLQGGNLATKLESLLGVDLLTKILSVGCDDLPKELTGRFWSAVADLLSCRVQDEDEEDMSGQVMVSQAVPGTLASGGGNDNTDSQVVLGVANVHVDAVVL